MEDNRVINPNHTGTVHKYKLNPKCMINLNSNKIPKAIFMEFNIRKTYSPGQKFISNKRTSYKPE